MSKPNSISQARLRDFFDYRDGHLVRKISTSPQAKAGAIAGCLTGNGYLTIMVDRKAYLAHRLVWLWHHGSFPITEIDHINRIKTDNRIENLRVATRSQNGCNKLAMRTNSSGYKGVSYHKAARAWSAQIHFEGRKKHLGLFNTPELAHEFYCLAADVLHGEFSRY